MKTNNETGDKKSTEISTKYHSEVNTSLSTLNLLDPNQVTKAEVILKRLITSEKSGIKNVQDGLAIMMRAQDLNLPFSTCVEHIHLIGTKTGVDIHIIKALLSRAGVVWELVKDYTPQYQYTDGNSIYLDSLLPDYCVKCKNAKEAEEKSVDGTIGVYPLAYYMSLKGDVYNEFQISSKCVKCINKTQANAVAAKGEFPVIRIPAQPIDYVTEYKFTRYRKINGREVISTAVSHFSYSEATTAGFFEKDTYKKYPRIMVSHRAFTLGARDIADDLVMGLMESTELGIVDDRTLESPEYIDAEEIQV